MPDPVDPYNLQRFVDAQQQVYMQVVSELRRGRKQSHWMWFIFPQISGLGHSSTARYYAVQSLNEAKAYLAHPLLGLRLRQCTQLINHSGSRSIEEILGSLDALKFRSCVTLFWRASDGDPIFQASLDQFFAGQPDPLTLAQLDVIGLARRNE